MQPYQALYDARRQAVEAMIEESLLEAEAKTRGVTTAQLLEQEVTRKIVPATDAESQAYYEANKARMGTQTYEQVKPGIDNMLNGQKQRAAHVAFLDTLKKKTPVSVLLDAPRVDVPVAANDPRKGPDSAPVRIVEFSEFQCPFCSRVGPTMKKIHETYGDKVQFVFRDYPLPMHQNAKPAAEAAQCANAQGKFWEFHDKAFANQGTLTADKFKEWAKELGLDQAKFDQCVTSGQFRQAVLDDFEVGGKVGVRGTPAFFVNGRMLSGAQPFEAFQAIIDEELKKPAKAAAR
jgi:protein-disulfide isomerase